MRDSEYDYHVGTCVFMPDMIQTFCSLQIGPGLPHLLAASVAIDNRTMYCRLAVWGRVKNRAAMNDTCAV